MNPSYLIRGGFFVYTNPCRGNTRQGTAWAARRAGKAFPGRAAQDFPPDSKTKPQKEKEGKNDSI